MGAVQHLGRFLHGREEAEAARHEGDVVVDRLGHADNRERMAAPGGLLEQGIAAALRAVATDREQDVDLPPDQGVDRAADVNGAARGAEECAALLVDAGDDGRRQRDRIRADGRVEPLVAAPEPEHFPDAIAMLQLQENRADDVVQAGAQAAAGDDAGAGVRRIEEQPLARPGQLEEHLGRQGRLAGIPDDLLGNQQVVRHSPPDGRPESGLTENGNGHGTGS